MKITHHGYSCALVTDPKMTDLTFSVWPEWDYRWIGRNLEVLKHYPKEYEEAAKNDKFPGLKTGVANLL